MKLFLYEITFIIDKCAILKKLGPNRFWKTIMPHIPICALN